MLKSLCAALLLAIPCCFAFAPKANAYPYFFNGYSGNGYGSYSLTSGGYYGNVTTWSTPNYAQSSYYDNNGNYSTSSCYRIGRYISCSGY